MKKIIEINKRSECLPGDLALRRALMVGMPESRAT